ncbi:MAG: hypothetical protein R3223_00015 [Longimicrobiales bacterium]|nr:hypothetical protein [Longimicrobiales bacterium]
MNAAHVHLVLNHVPILGFAFGVLLLGWARWRGSEETVRAALALFFLVGLTSIAVFFSGEQAEDVVEGVAGVSHDAIEVHEEFAELAMIVAVVVGLGSAGALVAFWKRALPGWVTNVGLLAGLVTFGMLGYAGFQGGQIHHPEIRSGAVPAGESEEEMEIEGEESRAAPNPQGTDAAASGSLALPGLFSIMIDLQGEMARVSRGLWSENLDTVAVGARAVANHPRVPPSEFERISGVLGSEMNRFREMDVRVHDLAVRLGEEADEGDLDAAVSTDAELRRACVACHSAFRDPLRDEIP